MSILAELLIQCAVILIRAEHINLLKCLIGRGEALGLLPHLYATLHAAHVLDQLGCSLNIFRIGRRGKRPGTGRCITPTVPIIADDIGRNANIEIGVAGVNGIHFPRTVKLESCPPAFEQFINRRLGHIAILHNRPEQLHRLHIFRRIKNAVHGHAILAHHISPV